MFEFGLNKVVGFPKGLISHLMSIVTESARIRVTSICFEQVIEIRWKELIKSSG